MKCDGQQSKLTYAWLDVCWKPLQRSMRWSTMVIGHMQHVAMVIGNVVIAHGKYVLLVHITLSTSRCQVNGQRFAFHHESHRCYFKVVGDPNTLS